MGALSVRRRHTPSEPHGDGYVPSADQVSPKDTTDPSMHRFLLYFLDEEVERTCRISRFEQQTYCSLLLTLLIELCIYEAVRSNRDLAIHAAPAVIIGILLMLARVALIKASDTAAACQLYCAVTRFLMPIGTAAYLAVQWWRPVALSATDELALGLIYFFSAVLARLDLPLWMRLRTYGAHVLLWLCSPAAGSHIVVPPLGIESSAVARLLASLVVACYLALGEAAGFPLERQARAHFLHLRRAEEAERRAAEAEATAHALRAQLRAKMESQASELRRAMEVEQLAAELRVKLDAQSEVLSQAISFRSCLGLAQLQREIAFDRLTINEKVGSGGSAGCKRPLPCLTTAPHLPPWTV